MGVQGLWSIINCSGKNIDLSTLEGKVLAVDLSIWLNQALKSGNECPNAHLQLLFNRICKLLFYKIKPIFVFDGPAPSIKRHALEERRRSRQSLNDRTEQIRSNIINILMKRNIIQKTRTQIKKVKERCDIFKLEDGTSELDFGININTEFSDVATDYISHFNSIDDVDIESDSFHVLPLEVRHEILRTITKEKRYGLDTGKDSYTDLNSNDFSGLQIERLLSRNNLHQRIDNLRSTMNHRDCRQILDSSKLSCLEEFSYASVSAKRIISHDDGYLMLIDPCDDDLILSLSESKKETWKGIKKNKLEENTATEIANDEETCLLEESENCLNEQDLLTILKCVPKLKCNVAQPAEKFNQSKKDVVQNDVILPTIEEYPVVKSAFYDTVNNTQYDDNETNTIKDTCNYEIDFANNLSEDLITDVSDGLKSVNAGEIESVEDIDSDSDNDFIDVPDTNEENPDIHYITSSEFDDNIAKIKLTNSFSLNKPENATLNEQNLYEADNHKKNPTPENWDPSIEISLSNLYDKKEKLEHQTIAVSERYFQDSKELLRLFGIPFVESPAEAEAQCAFLESVGLTNGTITEDSDIWLFGGQTVYKHVFTSGFSVREYCSRDIYKKLGLNRDLMICIALLSGGDYTPGIFGVGPVNAMEILAEFSDLDLPMTNFQVLERFKNWSEEHKTSSVVSNRKRFLRFELSENFPDATVYEAYNNPLVDESKEPFIWSSQSTDKLIEFIHTKVGMEKLKVIEMLEVVLRSKKKSTMCQKRITDFLECQVQDHQKFPSKRLKQATEQRNTICENSFLKNQSN